MTSGLGVPTSRSGPSVPRIVAAPAVPTATSAAEATRTSARPDTTVTVLPSGRTVEWFRHCRTGTTGGNRTEEDDDGEGPGPERQGRPPVRGPAPPGREQGEGRADRERGQPQCERPQGRQGQRVRGSLEGGPAEEGAPGRDRRPLEDEQGRAHQRAPEPLAG